MFRIDGTNMLLTRGDSCTFDVTIKNADGTAYVPSDGDTIRFAVKMRFEDMTPAIEKERTGSNVFTLTPSDTAGMELGEYVYGVAITLSDGTKNTIIGSSGNAAPKFVLLPEV